MTNRHWPLVGCENLCDIGGYPTLDGHRTRWQQVYRSDSLHALPSASQHAVVAAGIRTVIDLRSVDEQVGDPSVFIDHPTIRYRALPFYGAASAYDLPIPADLATLYRRDVDHYGPSIAAILRSLLEPETMPVVIHCVFGKDRTGIILALVLGLAGVDPHTICVDYVLSATYLAGTLQGIRAETPPADLARYGFSLDCTTAVMEDLLQHWTRHYGGIHGYLCTIGLSYREILVLRTLIVDESRSSTASR